jgi:hypothetical protein
MTPTLQHPLWITLECAATECTRSTSAWAWRTSTMFQSIAVVAPTRGCTVMCSTHQLCIPGEGQCALPVDHDVMVPRVYQLTDLGIV